MISGGAIVCFFYLAALTEAGHSRAQISASLETRQYERALWLADAALRNDPKDAELHDLRGVALVELSRPEDARSAFRASIKLNPRLSSAHYHAGLLEQRLGSVQSAIDFQQEALRRSPGFVPARYALSSLCWQVGDLDGAIRLLKQIVNDQPGVSEVWLNLGLALSRKGGRLAEATQALRSAVALDPRQLHAQLALAQLLSEQDDWSGAFDAFEKAKALAPQDAEVASNYGAALRSRGDLERATAELRRALELNPGQAAARRTFGILLRQKGEYRASLSELCRATELDPNDAEAWRLRGAVYLRLGDIDAAIASQRRATALDPDSADGYRLLAQALDRAGKAEEANHARELAEQAEAKKRARSEALLAVQRSDEQQKAGDLDGARETLAEAVRIDPRFALVQYRLAVVNRASYRPASEVLAALSAAKAAGIRSPEIYDLTGAVLLEQGKMADALEQWQLAIALAPSDLQARRSFGSAACKLGRWNEAIGQFRAILAWSPDDLDALRSLGLAALRTGDLSEARAALEGVLARLPGDPESSRAMRQLDGPKERKPGASDPKPSKAIKADY